VNPDLMPTTVAVPVRDTSGLVIGTTSVPLAAKSKVAVVLSGLPGLSAMLGSRGSAHFTIAQQAEPVTVQIAYVAPF